jgi:YD repeat-containing protein
MKTSLVFLLGASLLAAVPLSSGATSVNDSDDIAFSSSPSGALELGSVVWSVSEPYINLWITAEPLAYTPSRGPSVVLDLIYKQRGSRPFDDDSGFKPRAFSVGGTWTCSWLSYVAYNDPGATATVYFNCGGSRSFTADGLTVDYVTNTKVNRNLSGNSVTSFERTFPSGAKEIFAFLVNGTASKYAFRTAAVDPAGFTTTFNYTTYTDGNGNINVRLSSVTDPDGRSTSLTYGNASYPNYITQVSDPFGRSATLQYDSSGKLQTITDTGNLSTTVSYNGGVVSSYTTCYGTTSFTITDPGGQAVDGRAVQVTEADSKKQLFVYRDGLSSILPASYPVGDVPTTSSFGNSFDNTAMADRNSFHWDRKQFTGLSSAYTSSGNIYNLTAADFKIAQLKHWLKDTSSSYVSGTLSMERSASPDGTADGQKTWYDYTGKSPADTRGTQVLPLFVAHVPPGGSSWFSRTQRNSWGKPTQTDSTYTLSDGTVGVRTFTSNYSSDGTDLLEERGPNNQLLRSYTYNSYHQLLTKGEVVDANTTYTTTYTYDPTYRQLSTIALPTGLSRTYTYNTDRRVSQFADQPINRNEFFTYFANGLVQTQTDARGLVRTFTWDNLQRLTRVDYPDSTYLSYSYTQNGTPILDPTSARDRLGNTTTFAYDGLRHVISVTDPLNHTTAYSYPYGPDQPATATNPLSQVIRFGYDNNGLLTQTTFADGTSDARSFKCSYDSLGQRTGMQTQAGASFESYGYSNQGWVNSVSNPAGQVQSSFMIFTTGPPQSHTLLRLRSLSLMTFWDGP